MDAENKSQNKQTTITQFFKPAKNLPNEEPGEKSPTPTCFSVSDFCSDSDEGESNISTKIVTRWKRADPSKWKVNVTKKKIVQKVYHT